MRNTGYCSLLLFGMVAATQMAAAENTRRATTELDTVVVTASRADSGLSETPAAVSRLSDEDIHNNKPRLISDVIDRIPGVHMVDLGNEQHSMSIRQPITTNAVYQYLEDNIPIRPLGVFNHNALNEINFAGTGELEVMRGPSSSLYGSNAVGGTVNFLTAEPSLTPEAWVGVRGSNQGYRRLDAGGSTTQGDLGLRVSYYRSDVEDGWREHSDGHKDSLTLRADYALTPQTLLKTTASYTDMYTDMTGTLGESDYRNTPRKSDQTFTERTDKNTRINTSLETDWNGYQSSRVTVFWRDNSHGQIPSYQLGSCAPVAPATTCTTNGRQNDNAYTSYGLDAQWTQRWDTWNSRVIAGFGWDRTDNEFRDDNLTVTRDAQRRYIGYVFNNQRRRYNALIDNPSVYLQGEMKPWPAVTLVGGLRYDEIRYDFNNRLEPSAVTGAPDEQREFSKVSPRLGLAHQLAAGREWFVNASEGFVPPEVSQLYSSLDVPNLKEATFRNIETGFRQRWADAGRFEITLYELRGRDEIVSYTVQTTPTLIRENRNAGKTLHRGVELGFGQQVFTDVDVFLSYTWAQHRYDDYRPSTTLDFSGNDMPGAPEHIGVVGVNWQITPALTLTPEVQHLSSYWMNDLNTVRYDGHTLGHIRLRYQQRQWELYAQVLNVADVRYAHSASSRYNSGTYNPDLQNSYTPGEPRTFVAGLQYRFGQ